MKNKAKLLIFTSPNGPEFQNYWSLDPDVDHPIVKKGGKVFGKGIEWRKVDELIVDKGVVVLIHKANTPRFEVRKTCKGLEYVVYYYSSTFNDICSIDANLSYCFNGGENSLKPLDVLASAISSKNETDIQSAVEKLIEHVNREIQRVSKLEIALDFLHDCTNSKEHLDLNPELEKEEKARDAYIEWCKGTDKNARIEFPAIVLNWAGVQ